MRGRQKKETGKPQLPKPPAPVVVIDYKNSPKICVHYKNGLEDAERGFKPVWFDDEATEWKCVERDAYRAGYRSFKP